MSDAYDELAHDTMFKLNEKYKSNLCYMAPESMIICDYKRNPVVLMAKMGQFAPTKEILSRFVSLAKMAASIPINSIMYEWWLPVSQYHLFEIIGNIDAPWKQTCLNIWLDQEMVDQEVPAPQPVQPPQPPQPPQVQPVQPLQ